MLLSEAIEAMIEALLAEGVSDATILNYRSNLKHLLDFLGDVPVESITVHDLRKYASYLRSRPKKYEDHPNMPEKEGHLSPFTVDSYLRSVRRLFNWLMEEGIISENPMKRLKWKNPGRHEPKAISMEDYEKLLEATNGNSPREIRNTAIILLMGDTGCRAGGIANLRLEDVDLEKAVVRFTEKGNKTRKVPISPTTVKALRRWLKVRPEVNDDHFFVNLGVHGKVGLTSDAIGEIFRRLKKKAGIKGPANPHSVRHAFAREYIRNGGDMGTLAELMGHSSIEVTWKFYSIFRVEELREKHSRFSPVARLGKENEE